MECSQHQEINYFPWYEDSIEYGDEVCSDNEEISNYFIVDSSENEKSEKTEEVAMKKAHDAPMRYMASLRLSVSNGTL